MQNSYFNSNLKSIKCSFRALELTLIIEDFSKIFNNVFNDKVSKTKTATVGRYDDTKVSNFILGQDVEEPKYQNLFGDKI